MAGCKSNLGEAQTNKFLFGAPELRVGPLSEAGVLTQAHSLGVIEDAGLTYTREFTEKRGGPGNPVLARGISSSDAMITGSISELTRRNLSLLVGDGIASDADRDLLTTITAVAAIGDTTISVAAVSQGATNLATGDILNIYPVGRPEHIQSVTITSIAALVITIDQPLIYALVALDMVSLAVATGIGAVCGESYITVQLVSTLTSGTPFLVHGWYGSITSGLELSTNNSSFSTSSLEISLYPTPSSLTSVGAVMEPAKKLIDLGKTVLIT